VSALRAGALAQVLLAPAAVRLERNAL